MQLKAAYEENSENGAEFDVFGAITTTDTWIFVLYDGENFYETDKCTVGSSPKFTNLHIVVSWLVSILDYISENK
jgi:hypothetical protein